MNTQEQLVKLQGLLARIKRNADRPRVAAPPAPQAAVAPPKPAPLVSGIPPVAPAPGFIPGPAPIGDQAVDELLKAAPSPALPEVDVPLDTLPPVAQPAEAPAHAEQPPEAAMPPPAAPSPDEAFSLESEVSEVRSTSGLREETEVTVAAIAAEAEVIATEELSEDDLVEVTEAAAAGTDVDVDFDVEQPPASSQRSRVPSSMDEALASAAQLEADAEVDVPIKTPPPESGPQEAPAPAVTAAAAADVDALLAQEIDIPTREAIAAPPILGPTPEQLGQTIDLEESRGPAIELVEHAPEQAVAAAPAEELEVALPSRDVAGGYDHTLEPPPDALNDLEAHRRRLEDENIPPPPESLAQLPSIQPHVVVPEITPIQTAPEAPLAPEIVARPIPLGAPETFASVREPFRPSSFVELLDASLALRGD